MPTLVPKTQVGVHRDGKTVRPTIGEAFEFTKEEAQHFGKEHLRLPRNEEIRQVAAPEVTSDDDDDLGSDGGDAGETQDDAPATRRLTKAEQKAAAKKAAATKTADPDEDESL